MIFLRRPEMIYAVSGGAFTYPEAIIPSSAITAIMATTTPKLIPVNILILLFSTGLVDS